MHRIPHGSDTDRAAAYIPPGLNPVAEPRIGILLRVSPQPVEIHSARIIASPWLGFHVIRFALPAQETADRCQTDPKHVGRLFVSACLPRPVGRNDTST